MQFDAIYYDTLLGVINDPQECPDGKWQWVDDHTDTPERLIFHLKHYINNQKVTGIMITLSENYDEAPLIDTKFRIDYPFVDNISKYDFKVRKNATPMVLKYDKQMIEVVSKIKKDPFRSMRPKYKQGDLL